MKCKPPLAALIAAIICLALPSCDTPEAAAQRALSKESIEASGHSLVRYTTTGDTRVVSLLLTAGVHTESVDSTGRTPLAIAFQAGNKPLFDQLLASGANPNATLGPGKLSLVGSAAPLSDDSYIHALLAKGGNWDTALATGERLFPWAIRAGRLNLVEALIRAGADPHLVDASGKPILLQAMESGHREVVLSLIRLGADPGTRAPDGGSILHYALKNGWDDMLVPLARAGADPNARSHNGSTLLEDVLRAGDLPRLRLVLSCGADPNLSREPGLPSPLSSALSADSTGALATFLSAGAAPRDGWDMAFARLVARRDLAKIRLLLAHRIRPSTRGAGGFTPVEQAVLARDATLTKLLLDHSLPAGRALYFASARGDHYLAGLLAADGAALDATAFPSLDTPLAAALRGGHDRCAALLLDHGATFSFRTPEGQIPFHVALATGCSSTLERFLARGVDANAPFHTPVSHSYLRLIRPGIARWSLAKDSGATPVMIAADSGNIAVARTLLKAGAKTGSYTRAGRLWPINFASRRSDTAMMRLFLGQEPHTTERLIIVNLSEQRARVFDASGKEIFATRVSTGRRGFSTPTGQYVITNKHRAWTSTIYHASMPFFQRLSCSDFGLHQGVVPGYPASHGCIRVPAGNASKLFAMTRAGDRVHIVSSGWPGIPESPAELPIQSADISLPR